MHIVYLSHEYPLWATGGIGSFLQTLSRGLVKDGHMVTIIGVGDGAVEERIDDEGVILYRLAKSNWPKFKFIPNNSSIVKKLKKINKLEKIDIVEASELGLAFLPKNLPYKKVIRLHGGHHFFAESENRKVNKWKGFQEKQSFKKADAFIAVSDYVRQHTSTMLSYNGKLIKKIPYPLDVNRFYKSDASKIEKHSIVFAGTVCEKKGIRQLILALPKIIQEFPDAHLEVYGRDWHYKEIPSYIEYLKKNINKEVLKYVTFHGEIKYKELPKYYEKAEVCVFPSHMETQGLVAPEAMLMNKLVIFTDIGPGPETIEHKKTGLLCDPHSPESIADQVIYAFRNKELAKELAGNGRSFVLKKFCPDINMRKNVEFYKEVLKS